MLRARSWVISFLLFTIYVTPTCYETSPAFPVPSWSNGIEELSSTFSSIEGSLSQIIEADKYETSSFSISVTSTSEELWSHFHTARKQNVTRPGTQHVDGESLYRIASITKTFTVLGILYQHEAGNLSLDDPILNYIPDLEGKIPWKDITLRSLASQLSGIPREFAQGDVLHTFSDPTSIGLPPATEDDFAGLPTCDEYDNYDPCERKDLLKGLKTKTPIFAPNQKSTYSNVAFELLGLALENVTGMKYEDYIDSAILEPLNMSSSTFTTPSDSHAVLPIGQSYWDINEGVQNPTGGIYSSSFDMTKFVQYILTHFNAVATGVNWMQPASWGGGMNGFYGMPFEIFRTDRILRQSRRPVTFVTKGGGLPGYFSIIAMMPEYGLGLTILVGGENELLGEILETATTTLINAAEEVIWSSMANTHAATYAATDPALNSSLTLSVSPAKGLHVSEFISNSTDVLNDILPGLIFHQDGSSYLQLVPTLLYKNESAQQGEIWRATGATERTREADGKIWDDFCLADVDPVSYAGRPLNEVVFWLEDGVVELPAWKVEMKRNAEDRTEDAAGDSPLVVQD